MQVNGLSGAGSKTAGIKMAQAKVQGRAVTGMEGRIRGLKAEIRQDAGKCLKRNKKSLKNWSRRNCQHLHPR